MTTTRRFRPMRLVARIAAAAALLTVALLGWRTISRLPVSTVTVHGARYADEADILALARIADASVLMDVSPTLVADRIRRHPWIAGARVNRLPTGTVSIRVTEREPVLLALSSEGEPHYWIDAEGHRMPYVTGAFRPVPVLRGLREPYHPVSRVRNAAVGELASSLADIDPDVDALLSEFEVAPDGGLLLRTAPTPEGRTLSVRLGKTGIEKRLARLHAFWDQVVLTRPSVRYAWIDLRFDSQIVTSETS